MAFYLLLLGILVVLFRAPFSVASFCVYNIWDLLLAGWRVFCLSFTKNHGWFEVRIQDSWKGLALFVHLRLFATNLAEIGYMISLQHILRLKRLQLQRF